LPAAVLFGAPPFEHCFLRLAIFLLPKGAKANFFSPKDFETNFLSQ